MTGTTTVTSAYVGTASGAPLDAIPLASGNSLLTFASTTSARSVGGIVVNKTVPRRAGAGGDAVYPQHRGTAICSIGVVLFAGSTSILALIIKAIGAASKTAILGWSGVSLIVAHAAASTGFPAGAAGGAVTLVSDANGVIHIFDFTWTTSGGVGSACKSAVLDGSNVVSSVVTMGYTSSPKFTRGPDGPYLAGKAFILGGAPYVPVAMGSELQPGLYVMDAAGNIQASALYGSLAASSSNPVFASGAKWGSILPGSPVVSQNIVSLATAQQGKLSFTNSVNTTASGVARLLLGYGRTDALQQQYAPVASPPLWHAQAANCLYFSGSYLGMYDGRQCSEAGFFYFPEDTAVDAVAGNGITGTFLFLAVYEWVDGQGQRHQSAPSPSVPITLTDGSGIAGGVNYHAATLRIGARAPGATVVFYRTQAQGTTFYRINAVNNAIANDPTTGIVNGTDSTMTTSAAADPIAANEILYTTGGYLPNDNPPACNAIAEYQGRIIFSNAEDDQDWRFSQPPSIGQGLYFNEALLGGRTPQETGRISAFGVLDDKLIICTPTNKLWTSGQGPAANGLNGSYSQPQVLPSGVGCIDQRTIVVIPDVSIQDSPVQIARAGGLAHYSSQGLFLLTRGLSDEFFGFAMGDQLSGPISTSGISGAVLMEDKGQVRWTTSGNTPTADVIVYDYLFGQWSTFTASLGTTCAVIWGGNWTFGSGHAIYQDEGFPGLDFGTTPVVGSFTTAWIKLAALQGFERIRKAVFFGPYSSPSTITIVENTEYDTVTGSWPSMSILTSGLKTKDGLRWQFRWGVPQQKCQAIQFVVTDTPDGTGANPTGAGFSGMTLELGVKKGTAKLSAGKST